MDQVRQVLGKFGNLAIGPEVAKQLLARAETAERVLRQIVPYHRACTIFMGNFLLGIGTALISKVVRSMSSGKSDIPQILQPKIREIKGYLKELESKNNEIDRVMNQIEEMIESRNYELTRRENERMETLVSTVEYESKRLKNYFNEADKTLTSLHSDVVSYKNNKGLSGWNVFLSVAAGAGASALGVAFFPVVAPAAAVCGGGFFAGLGGFLYEKEAKNREDAMVDAEIMQLQRRLNILQTGVRDKELNVAILFGASVGFAVSGFMLCLQLKRWYATRKFCNRLCSIIQNYSDKVDEMNRFLNSRRM
ncbi:uncharacterized protein LOC114967645 isoform X2 [Acropora millepora]|uniref:uncharacterized protein LOC114967645 isoform X2 n=1 Tax=Acropora millepora TaxID=45264 RepID=UPI001CF196D0|nr:uncharacterized protein LOC114967645 isoform X2 [Acropora millepora]